MSRFDYLTKMHRYTAEELSNYQKYLSQEAPEKLSLLDTYLSEDTEEIVKFHGNSQEQSFSGHPDRQPVSETICLFQQERFVPSQAHKHDFCEILYLKSGEMVQTVEGVSFLMEAGDFCLISPGCYHTAEFMANNVVLVIRIAKGIFKDIMAQMLGGSNRLMEFFLGDTYAQSIYDYLLFHTEESKQIQSLLEDMIRDAMTGGSYAEEILKIRTLLLFGLLLKDFGDNCVSHSRKKKKDQQDYDILRYIDENYRTVSLSELEEEFHFSGHYISTRIRLLTGGSFMDYLQTKRMQHAVEMLTTTNIKIKDISNMLGYNNQEHFIRTFRKYYGQTPTRYRSMHFKG